MNWTPGEPWVAATVIAAVACVTDVRWRRIPNVLTFGGAAFGLAYHVITGGISGLLFGATGWMIGVAVFLPLFVLRGMGAGDLKLLGALGAWIGASNVLWVALYTTIAGGVLALGVAAWHRQLGTSIRNMGHLLWYWRMVGIKPVPDHSLNQSSGLRLPYAVPIFAGAIVRLWTAT